MGRAERDSLEVFNWDAGKAEIRIDSESEATVVRRITQQYTAGSSQLEAPCSPRRRKAFLIRREPQSVYANQYTLSRGSQFPIHGQGALGGEADTLSKMIKSLWG